MTQQLAIENNETSLNRIFLEIEVRELRSVTKKYIALESKFSQNKSSIFNNIQEYADFSKDFEECYLACKEMEDLARDPHIKQLGALVRGQLKSLYDKLPIVSTPFAEPKVVLLEIAEKFKQHNDKEAMRDFFLFATKFPKFAQQVYNNLWWLKGSPSTLCYGQSAFHNQDGCYSLDIEKAEAIMLLYSSPKDWLSKIKELFQSEEDRKATLELKKFSAIYPEAGDLFFNMLWKMSDSRRQPPTSHASYDPFELLNYYSKHFDLNSKPSKKIQAIDLALVQIENQITNPDFFIEQNKLRRQLRCSAVINEHIALLKVGYYFNRSGKNCGIQMDLMRSILETEIYPNGGSDHPKTPRFKRTVFEVRRQSCISVAYELALNKENSVNVMNIAHCHVPGGNYRTHVGSQEEELFRCTGLSLALDSSQLVQKKTFYPIHHQDAAGKWGAIYTPHTPLIRLGYDCDYCLVEKPATISVGTFAAFRNSPPGHVNQLCIPEEMSKSTRERIRSYLKSAYDHGDDTLIMGSFSCEDFANPLGPIAEIMMEVIDEEYSGCFKKIIFTVLNDTEEGYQNNPSSDFYQFSDIVRRRGGLVYDANGNEIV